MRANSSRIVALGAFSMAIAMAGTAQAQVYYRLETGYSQSFGADFKDKDSGNFLICGDAACNTPGKLDDFGSSIILGAGVGYRFNTNLRGDVTLGYRPSYKLDTSDKSVPATKFSSDVTSLAFMINGYFDLPMTGFTPYVGAGVGYAQNKIGRITFNDGAGFSGSAPGGTWAGMAWNVMVGAEIPLPGSLPKLDVGYRYIDLGNVESGSDLATLNGFGSFPYGGAKGKLKANELFVGLRF